MSICIVYFSIDGHTRALGEAIAAGSGAALLDVTSLSAQDWEALDQADAIIMGAPTYMGGLPASFVQFIEAAATRWDTGQWRDKLAGGFSTAMHPAGDKMNALISLFVFASQMGMVWIGAAETGAPITEGNEGINADGSWVGVSATASTEHGVLLSEGDLETARRYGVRMQRAVQRWAGALPPSQTS